MKIKAQRTYTLTVAQRDALIIAIEQECGIGGPAGPWEDDRNDAIRTAVLAAFPDMAFGSPHPVARKQKR